MEEKKKSANSIDLKKYLDKKYWKVYAAALLALVLLVTVIVLVVGSGNSDNPQEPLPNSKLQPKPKLQHLLSKQMIPLWYAQAFRQKS